VIAALQHALVLSQQESIYKNYIHGPHNFPVLLDKSHIHNHNWFVACVPTLFEFLPMFSYFSLIPMNASKILQWIRWLFYRKKHIARGVDKHLDLRAIIYCVAVRLGDDRQLLLTILQ
jgi:hypothetical protein